MKRMAIALAGLLPAVGYLVWFLGVSSRLPDPLAVHFGFDGTADGFAPAAFHFWFSLILLGVPALIWLGLSLARPAVPALGRVAQVILVMFYVIILWILVAVVLTQLDLTDAAQARISPSVFIAIVPVFVLIPFLLSKPRVQLGQQLTINYWGLSIAKIPYAEIVSVEVVIGRARDFGGWGIRYANRTLAFLPSGGECVELETTSGGKILIRSDRATALASEIEQIRKSK
jgi:hypothetical protein